MHAYHLQCDSASEMQTMTLGSPVWDIGEVNFFKYGT